MEGITDMKKMSFLLLAAITLVLLTSCKSEAAKAVDDAISSLGEITLESEKEISTVENMVDSLEEADLEQLDNLDELRNARETYEALVLEKAISQVEDAINSIGKVTLNSQSAIDKARELFNSSEKEVQEGVQNADILEAAEKELHSLRAGEVEKLISQIGEVTIEKEEQIRNANSEFDALTTEEKNLVSNKDILTESLEELEKQIEEKKAAELEEAFYTFYSQHNIYEAILLSTGNDFGEYVSHYDTLTDLHNKLIEFETTLAYSGDNPYILRYIQMVSTMREGVELRLQAGIKQDSTAWNRGLELIKESLGELASLAHILADAGY